MKKIIFTALILFIFIMLITGCSGTNDSANIKTDSSDAAQPGYGINTDDSFNSGIETEPVRETLSPEEADFRNLKWGMTKDEVINVEGSGARETKENTLYYTRVREEEYPADAEYTFIDNKLAQGIFYIKENKDGGSITLDDYDELVNSLKDRYGDPDIIDLRFASDDLKTDDREEMMNLIKTNQFNYKTGWDLDKTELSVVLFNKDNAVCIGLRYKDKNVTIDA